MFEQCQREEETELKAKKDKDAQEKTARKNERALTRAERQKRKEERIREKQREKEEAKKDDPNAKAFSAPPPALLSWVFSFLNGV